MYNLGTCGEIRYLKERANYHSPLPRQYSVGANGNSPNGTLFLYKPLKGLDPSFLLEMA
jgi:hypothetical protein